MPALWGIINSFTDYSVDYGDYLGRFLGPSNLPDFFKLVVIFDFDFFHQRHVLTELNLQKFDTVIDKCRGSFQRQIHACENGIIQHFVYLHLM